MKILVISYSLTGNNEILAENVAKEFSAEHIRIKEEKSRTNSSIFMDIIFRRTPKVQPVPDKMRNYDLILFAGPIWVGQIATPLRAYLQFLKKYPINYAFFSISGGAIGNNTKLNDELKKRVGKGSIAMVDLHIADLLPKEPKPSREDTSAYKINENDIRKLTNIVTKTIKDAISSRI